MNPKPKGAKLKEKIRQDKRKERKEVQQIIDDKKREKRAQLRAQREAEEAQLPAGKPVRGSKAGRPETAAPAPKKATARKTAALPIQKKKDLPVAGGGKGRSAAAGSPDKRVRTAPGQSAAPEKGKRNAYGKALAPRQRDDRHTPAEKPAPARERAQSAVYDDPDAMPLNKFIAHAGISGRREAADIIKQGLVKVDGSIVYEPGYKVTQQNDVRVKGKRVYPQKNQVYILLNKPKDYITTANDPEGRKTVLDLVKTATPDRVYPVGRLDRNTTGVLLLTNDGELAQKLTHPSYEIKKVYEVRLDQPLSKKDFELILQGVELEDGVVPVDSLGYVDDKDKSVVGIQIHSGKNRVVRRLFAHLGYDVKNLDRVMFANLTKKNVDRGKWRLLTEKEIRLLKYMNQSFVRKNTRADQA